MTITTTELDARATKGAALFDERYPGWATDVDRDRLDLSDTMLCVAAQVVCNSQGEEAYQDAMEELFGDSFGDERVEHGFTLSYWEVAERQRELGLYDASRTEIYAPLTAAWQRAIDARLKESAS